MPLNGLLRSVCCCDMTVEDVPRRSTRDRIPISYEKNRFGWLSVADEAFILELSNGKATAFLVDFHALTPKGGDLRLYQNTFSVQHEHREETLKWIDRAMSSAYGAQAPGRRVLLLVNPVGGKGKAKVLVDRVAMPILKAARCDVTFVETQHYKHAEELARSMSLDYDVIATASGDGLVHELINGFALRSDARKALRIPIVPIPTGSANGLCINLQGVDESFNIALACLNVIKGRAMPLDLCSVMIGDRRRWSAMTIAAGLMCDLDLGTEHLRWMGDARFVYGFVRGLAANRPMKCTVHIRVVTADKALMIQRLNISRQQSQATLRNGPTLPLDSSKVPEIALKEVTSQLQDSDRSTELDVMPLHRELRPTAEEGWITLESGTGYGTGKKSSLGGGGPGMQDPKGTWRDGEGILYIYTGTVPYVARDLMQFPVAIPGEGVVDVCVQTVVPRAVLAGSISGAEKGEPFYLDCQHYYKASAFIIEPLEEGKLVSIDGEAAAFERIVVEVHGGLGQTCSLTGGWAPNPFGSGRK